MLKKATSNKHRNQDLVDNSTNGYDHWLDDRLNDIATSQLAYIYIYIQRGSNKKNFYFVIIYTKNDIML